MHYIFIVIICKAFIPIYSYTKSYLKNAFCILQIRVYPIPVTMVVIASVTPTLEASNVNVVMVGMVIRAIKVLCYYIKRRG